MTRFIIQSETSPGMGWLGFVQQGTAPRGRDGSSQRYGAVNPWPGFSGAATVSAGFDGAAEAQESRSTGRIRRAALPGGCSRRSELVPEMPVQDAAVV